MSTNMPNVPGGSSAPESEFDDIRYAQSANVLLIDADYNLDDIAECWMQAHNDHDTAMSLKFLLLRRWRPDPQMESLPVMSKSGGQVQLVPVQLSYDDRNPDRLILQGYLTDAAVLEAPLVLVEENPDVDPADLQNHLRFRRMDSKILKGSFVKLFLDLCSGRGYIHSIGLRGSDTIIELAIPDDSIFSDDPDHEPYCPDCCLPVIDEDLILGANPPAPAEESAETPSEEGGDNPFNTDPDKT